jgi:hypothetical protein
MTDKIKNGNIPNRAGRPKGAINKTSASAKAVIEQAATELGGADRLLAWALEAPENEKAFWAQIYPKLLPLQVHGSGEGGAIVFKTVYEGKE